MAKSLQAKRAEARARTKKWREERRDKLIPEARAVDRALVSAFVHVTVRERRLIDRAGFVRVVRLAIRSLSRTFDPNAAADAVMQRIESLMKANEMGAMLMLDELDRKTASRRTAE